MFSAKCTNPNCGKPFDYRHGRCFRFHENSGGDPAISAIRHFWLCDACSREYTVQYADATAVLVRLEWPYSSEAKNHLVATV